MQYTVFPSHLVSSGSAGVAVPRRLWGDHYLLDNAVFAVICLVLLVGVWALDDNIVRTRVGRAFRCLKENESVAQSFGIDVVRYKLLAFVVSGAMAGLAGALYGQSVGHVDSGTFDLMSWSLPLVIMVIVGGMGHRLAVVIAAFFFFILPDVLGSLHALSPIIGMAKPCPDPSLLLFVLPHRLPLLQHRTQAFLHVFQVHQLVQVDIVRAFHRFFNRHSSEHFRQH